MSKRNINITLTDPDVGRLINKAANVGMTVAELIENFIGDLIENDHTNGSDERHFIKSWFDRCEFSMFPEKNLLTYLSTDPVYSPLEFIKFVEMIESLKKEIEVLQCELHNNEGEKKEIKEEIEYTQEDVKYYENQVQEIWEGFSKWTDKEPTFEEEKELLYRWKDEYDSLYSESEI